MGEFLIVNDQRGNLIKIQFGDDIKLDIINTRFERIREIKSFEDKFLAAIAHEKEEGKLVFFLKETLDKAESMT